MTKPDTNPQPLESTAPEISACFMLAGWNFDADACDRVTGLSATNVWRQKGTETRHRSDSKNMFWAYGVNNITSYSANDVVAGVVGDIWPRKKEILDFVQSNQLTARLCCNVTLYRDPLTLKLEPGTMRMLADLNAPFTLDIFDYGPTGEQP